MNYKIKERILKNLLIEITKKYDYLLNEFKAEDISKKNKLMYDYITGLLNRDGFKEKLKVMSDLAIKENKTIAVITLDLDNFKIINTSYGHEIGDIFLKKIAEKLRKISKSNWTVSRIGGDEFGIAIYGTSYQTVLQDVQTIKNSIENLKMKAGDSYITTTVSIGVSFFSKDSEDILFVFNKAEVGIYQSKNRGKSAITFPSEEEQTRFIKLEKIKKLIIEAVNNPENIPVFIQPIISLKDKQIIGGEILLRIASNNRVVPASEFIDAAITFGLLDKLEEIQLENFLTHRNIQILEGMFVFINRHIKSSNLKKTEELINKLSEFHRKTGINFVVEITENSFVENFSMLGKVISYAKSKNILFALDDFGAGFASFGYVSKVPVDIIKIDGSIIKECINNKNHQAIIKAISVLSSELNIKTIAEFIDNQEKAYRCLKYGIDFGQGYYLGKPVELSEFFKLLQK